MAKKYPSLKEGNSLLFPVMKKDGAIGEPNVGDLVRGICKRKLGVKLGKPEYILILQNLSISFYFYVARPESSQDDDGDRNALARSQWPLLDGMPG